MTLPTDVTDAAVIKVFTGIPALLDERPALVARGRVASIETKVCKLDLLTGEYDFSCTPEDTRRTAAAIGGASVTIMEQLGHFPMGENPGQFGRTIAPVLTEILTQSTVSTQGVDA